MRRYGPRAGPAAGAARTAGGRAEQPATGGGFARRVLAVVRRIPAGRVATYGDVASLAGRPRAWRAVGNVLRGCAEPGVPCHRVVGADGRLGGYADRTGKHGLLAAEGIRVTGGRLRRFAAIRWQGPGRR